MTVTSHHKRQIMQKSETFEKTQSLLFLSSLSQFVIRTFEWKLSRFSWKFYLSVVFSKVIYSHRSRVYFRYHWKECILICVWIMQHCVIANQAKATSLPYRRQRPISRMVAHSSLAMTTICRECVLRSRNLNFFNVVKHMRARGWKELHCIFLPAPVAGWLAETVPSTPRSSSTVKTGQR